MRLGQECQPKLTFSLCDNCARMGYRAEAEERFARGGFAKKPGEASETNGKCPVGQSGGGNDGRVEASTTVAAEPRAARRLRSTAFLAANLLRRRRERRRNIANVTP
jgi:hypothetical protein